MRRITRNTGIVAMVLASVALMTSGRSVWADATTSSVSDEIRQLRTELETMKQSNTQLRQQVNQLQAGSNENWLNERRAEEVKTLVREVLADADTRASMLEGGMTSGWTKENGFFMASEDGSFLLKVGGQFQWRYIYATRENAGAGQDDGENGFSMRRGKVFFKGNIGNPKIGYVLQLAANRDSSAVGLEEAYLTYKFCDGLVGTLGRFKGPFTREYMISSTKSLLVEPSYVDAQMAANYVEGAMITYTADPMRLYFSVNDGLRSGDIGGPSDFQNDTTDFAVTGRADLKLMGDWKQWEEFASWSSDKGPAMFLGAAVNYQTAETGQANPGGIQNDNILSWTVDGSFKASGFNVYSAVIGRHTLVDAPAAGAGDLDVYGWVVQGGYMVIPDKLEPIARFEAYDANGKAIAKIVTVGANYYLSKHNAKFTVDVLWALDEIASASTGVPILADAAGQEDQVVLRAQFQLLF
ncbi:MAG: hypothetical protein IT440_09385 [Phycisphaeraceae bacterium]|nr:hypothetical protein [Phycisphaeraceae bacterium]